MEDERSISVQVKNAKMHLPVDGLVAGIASKLIMSEIRIVTQVRVPPVALCSFRLTHMLVIDYVKTINLLFS